MDKCRCGHTREYHEILGSCDYPDCKCGWWGELTK